MAKLSSIVVDLTVVVGMVRLAQVDEVVVLHDLEFYDFKFGTCSDRLNAVFVQTANHAIQMLSELTSALRVSLSNLASPLKVLEPIFFSKHND